MRGSIIYTTVPEYGYGDIVVGLVSTTVISEIMNKKLYITFGTDTRNIFEYIPYKRYKNFINLLNPEKKHDMISLIKTKDNSTKIIISNQLWHALIYEDVKKFISKTWNLYKNLYTNVLFLKPELQEQAEKFILDKKINTGIQIRCGDYSWDKKVNNKYLDPNRFTIVINKIIDWIEKTGNTDGIFLTCDNRKFMKKAKKKLREYGIKAHTYSQSPQHFKDTKNENDLRDIVMEHYILSKCKNFLISKPFSNFGLTGSLASGSKDIWTFDKDYDSILKLKLDKKEDFIKG